MEKLSMILLFVVFGWHYETIRLSFGSVKFDNGDPVYDTQKKNNLLTKFVSIVLSTTNLPLLKLIRNLLVRTFSPRCLLTNLFGRNLYNLKYNINGSHTIYRDSFQRNSIFVYSEWIADRQIVCILCCVYTVFICTTYSPLTF